MALQDEPLLLIGVEAWQTFSPPTYSMRIALIAVVKNEARYLLEWLAYHRAIGIRHFFIADNGGDDGTSELLQRLHRVGLIVRFDFRNRHPAQMSAYNEILPNLRGFVDLAVILDCDEFVRPLISESIDVFFAKVFSDPTVSALALNWACYGSSGRVKDSRGLVITRFTKRAEQNLRANCHFKTVVRVDRFVSANNPHWFALTDGRYVDARGQSILTWHPEIGPGATTFPVWDGARIDHFLIKSLEEFNTIKRPRGRADLPKDHPDQYRTAHFFTGFDRNEISDPMPLRLVWRTRLRMLRMRRRLLFKG